MERRLISASLPTRNRLAKLWQLTCTEFNNKMSSRGMSDTQQTVIANGQEIAVELPLSLQRFLEAQGMPPRSVVVELNSEAVSPSEFSERQLQAGDRMEIVRVVAGG